MKFPNIRKCEKRPGQYIGSANGEWRIKRNGGDNGWRAVKTGGERFRCDPPAIAGKTLSEISKSLIDLDQKIAAEIAGHDVAVAAVHVEMARDLVLPNPFKGGM